MYDAGSAGERASIAWMLRLVDPTFGRALNITPNPHGGAAAPGAAASSALAYSIGAIRRRQRLGCWHLITCEVPIVLFPLGYRRRSCSGP
jgi:hypothetical protein